MINCENCRYKWLKEDKKNRPYFCCKCKLNYHWKTLIDPVEDFIFETLTRIVKLLVNKLNKLLDSFKRIFETVIFGFGGLKCLRNYFMMLM